MEGNHLAVTCQLVCEPSISTYALIDNGATGYAFMDIGFARHHHLKLLPLRNPRQLEAIDGHPISSGLTTHYVRA